MNLTEFNKFEQFTFRTAEQHISNYEYDSRVNIFHSFYGSGKTTSVINHYKRTNQTIVFVCPRRSLINDVCARFRNEGIEIYTHTELNEKGILPFYTGNIITTLESLTKIDLHSHKESLFIFDEMVSILKQTFAPMNRERQLDMMDRLIAIMRNCKTALFDANFNEIDIDLIHTIANKPFEKDFSIVNNGWYMPPKRNVFLFTNEGKWQETFIEFANSNKKILVMVDNKRYANELDFILNSDGIKSRVLSADTRKEVLENNTIKEFIETEKPQVLFITPTGYVGLDIQDNYFDLIFTYSDNFALTDYREYFQADYRCRNFELPIYDFSKPFERDITLKLDYLDILADMQNEKTNINRIARTYTNDDLFPMVEPRFQPFEIYLAKSQAIINANIQKGLRKCRHEYYESLGYTIEYITNEGNVIEIESIKETREEKKERLKNTPLVGKEEFDALRKKQAFTDLTLDEKAIKSKYELAENLKIGLTDVSRKDKVNKIYDFSVNDETLVNMSRRISAIIQPDLQKEIDDNKRKGIIFKHESLFLECEVFKKLYSSIKDKDFSKIDIDSDIIEQIKILRKPTNSYEFRDTILNTKGFTDLLKMGVMESLAIEYAYNIVKGDMETICAVYHDRITEIKLKSYLSLQKDIDRIKSRSKNPKTLDKNISRATIKSNLNADMKIKKFIKQIQADFTISPIKIVSDFLKYFGIKLIESGKDKYRSYRIDSEKSVFEILTNFSGTKGN